MGHSASVQPTRLTSSAKSSSSRVGVSSNSRVHSLPTLRKERRKDAKTCDAIRQVSDIDRSEMNGVTNTLPSDVKLSPEVIVSISLIFAFRAGHISHCIFHTSVPFIQRFWGQTTDSVHCTITGPCLRMHHRPLARTLQHVTVPIRNIHRFMRYLLWWSLSCLWTDFTLPSG